ncbi:MAG: hypothetical protein JXR48_06740 [Candidatus Delongbacteria bacterium]|nr:hypothetical protein [Candidatus Delongbacteria bacterium]MBN2834648.1 hypothetical protein [Candidatus Delongbacteria bacterium]
MIKKVLYLAIILGIISCNPFSPTESDLGEYLEISDNSTIAGLMSNFVYSYTFKDSFLYETILDSNFMFKYNNDGIYETWNKDEDLRITKRLFRNLTSLNLIYNNSFVEPSEESLDTTIIATFLLTINYGSFEDVFSGHAKYQFLKKNEKGKNVWKISYWEDLE